MTQPSRIARETHTVLLLRADGEVLGGEGYAGGPVVAVRWSDDPAELQRRVDAALEAAGISATETAVVK